MLSRWRGEEPIEPPSLGRKLLNLGVAAVKHAASGLARANDQALAERLEACANCTQLAEDDSCLRCGCPVKVKATWASESCPEGKWAAVPTRGGGCGCSARAETPPTQATRSSP